MHRVKKSVLGLVVLMAVVIILVFSLENQQTVSLKFLGWSTPQWALSIYVTAALLLGLAFGPLLSFFFSRRNKRDSSRHAGQSRI